MTERFQAAVDVPPLPWVGIAQVYPLGKSYSNGRLKMCGQPLNIINASQSKQIGSCDPFSKEGSCRDLFWNFLKLSVLLLFRDLY